MIPTAEARDGGEGRSALLSIRPKDGFLAVVFGERSLPLLRGGEPVAALLPGWRPRIVHAGFAPLFILELQNDDGSRVSWFLDERLQHLCDDVSRLPQSWLDHLRFRATPLLRSILSSVLTPTDLDVPPATADFLALNENTRSEIAGACVDLVARPPVTRLLGPEETGFAAYVDGRGAPGLFPLRSAADLLRIPLKTIYRAFCRPHDEAEQTKPVVGGFRVDGAVVIDDFHFAIRLVRPADDLVLFLIVGDHLSSVLGCWFPAGSLLLYDRPETGDIVGPIADALPSWFVRHAAVWAGDLVPYLARGAKRLASVMRGHPSVHIGHQLWNEISGIENAVVDRFDPVPEWIVPSAGAKVEIYGPIDELFPELSGRVNRTLRTVPEIIAYVYENDIMLCRLTSDRVSASLRTRIAGYARTRHPGISGQEGPASRGPIILVGLRVENRTLVDLPGFLSRLCGAIAARYPEATIVLDGHNSSDDTDGGVPISSHAESRASVRPIDVERAIAAGLRAQCAGSGIVVVDTIGAPIAASLAWVDASDCFVSIWGASLAKYRWACNKTGYTLTGRMNLLHRGDLHIYDLPDHMEAPTRLRFPDPDSVADEPDSVPLVDVARDSWALFNFSVDESVVIPDIMAFVAEAFEQRPRTAR